MLEINCALTEIHTFTEFMLAIKAQPPHRSPAANDDPKAIDFVDKVINEKFYRPSE